MLYSHYMVEMISKTATVPATAFGSEGGVYNILESKIGFEPSDTALNSLMTCIVIAVTVARVQICLAVRTSLSNDILIPTDYNRDTITASYELCVAKVTKVTWLCTTLETEIQRDESVMAPRWPSNRLSNNTAKNQNFSPEHEVPIGLSPNVV
ncbi:hypothetical protein O9929_26525 [Vibrio lentus]|nr:hypothetical protein [Vibrio lentus]